MGNLWTGESLRASFMFVSGTYVAVMDQESGTESNIIVAADFTLSDGDTAVNPLGVVSANSCSLTIYDSLDRLSSGNSESPYYRQVINGVKVLLEIQNSDGIWQPFGTWYTVAWSGRYSDGAVDVVSVSLEDELSSIGQRQLIFNNVFSSISGISLIKGVLTLAGVSADRVIIDDSLDVDIPYSLTKGRFVRDFLDDICQKLFARVFIDRNNKIVFLPALSSYEGGRSWDLTYEDLGDLYNRNEQGINFTSVEVSYYTRSNLVRDYFYDGYVDAVEGYNSYSLQASRDVVAVEQVDISIDGVDIDLHNYLAFQNYFLLYFTTSAAAEGVHVQALGLVKGDTTAKIKAYLDSSAPVELIFEYDSSSVLSESQAFERAVNIAGHIGDVSRSFGVSGVPLSPFFYPGDRVTISGTETATYDGVYKVTGVEMHFSEFYDINLKLIKIR
jgi:hypothetical protein